MKQVIFIIIFLTLFSSTTHTQNTLVFNHDDAGARITQRMECEQLLEEPPNCFSFSRFKYYPSPTYFDEVFIGFEIHERDWVNVSLSSPNQIVMKQVVSETLDPGYYFYYINLNDIPPGMYFFRVRACNRTRFFKLMVIR